MKGSAQGILFSHVSPLSDYADERDIYLRYQQGGRPLSGFRCKTGIRLHTFSHKRRHYFFDNSTLMLFSCSRMIRDIIDLSENHAKNRILSVLSDKYSMEDLQDGFMELDMLVAAGILSRSGKRHPRLKAKELSDTGYSTLVLGLTGACNLSCRYCFEGQDGNLSGATMSKETAAAAIDWFFERSTEDVPLTIRFFGGEPLLNPDVMEHAAAHAMKLAEEMDRNVRFVISTNGTILNEKAVKAIKRYNIGVCLSMDGPQRVHDRFRRDKRGTGSYRKVKQGLNRLLQEGIEVSAQAVITSASGDVEYLVRFFRNAGFSGLLLGFADYKKKSDFSMSGMFMRDFNRNYVHKVANCMADAGPCRLNLSGHDTILGRLYRHEPQFYGCKYNAGINMIYADSDGNIFPCYRLTDDKDLFGNVMKGLNKTLIDKKRLHVANDHVDLNECSSCIVRYLCGGICRANYKMSDRRAGCEKRRRIELNLKLYVELWHTRRELLRDLYS